MTMKRIICGDNLDIIKSIKSNSLDLVYIDPPFFTSRNYEIIWGDKAEIRAFDDRWVSMGDGKYSKDINVYLNFMQPRLEEIYRVLKKTGSFYLHCDYHADAYLRILCDTVFGENNFRNRICWKRTNAKGRSKKNFNINHDVILFYTKSSEYTFNIQLEEITIPKNAKKDKKGWYVTQPLIVKKRSSEDKTRIVEGREITLDEEQSWYATQDTINNYDGFYWTKRGLPRYKKYIKDGNPIDDIWDGIYLHPSSNERLGYPTQKPEALLERIISTSSNKGDLVADFFCGCGTTLAVAERLGRQWIGCDISTTACRLIANRVKLPIKNIEGIPLTPKEVSELNGYEFQNYIINMLTIYNELITIGKRGADGGIDGTYLEQLISVKKYKAGRKDLDEFVATIYRNKKKVGIFIALGYTSGFLKEVARLLREDEIEIFPLTLEQIINKEHFTILKKFRKNIDKFI